MHNSAAEVAGVRDLQQPGRRRLVQSTLFPHRSQDNATEKEDKDGDQKPNEEEQYCASQGKKKRQRKPGAPKKVAVNGKEIPSKKVDDKDCPAIENPDLFLKASEVQNPQKKQQCVGSPEENDKTCSPLESPANMKMPRQLKRHANSTPKKKQTQQVQTTPKKKIMNGLPEQISDSPIQSGSTTQSIPDVLLEAKMKAEMGSPKQRHFNLENQPLNSHNSPPSQLIQNLLSAIQAPQGLKPPLLKSLYYLLIHLSSNPPTCYPRAGTDSTFCSNGIGQYGIKVSFEDICSLSDISFKELSKMFRQFLSVLPDVSASQSPGQSRMQVDIRATAEQLNLLLRCCMVLLNLLVADQYRLLENGQVLLDILRELCSQNLTNRNDNNTISFEKVYHKYIYNDNDCSTSFTEDIVASLHFMEPVDLRLHYLCTMLEVFADELLVRGQLREYFKLIDSRSSTNRKLFMCHSSHGDIGSVIEVLSTHFCLSLPDEQAFENFLNRLFWLPGEDFRAPEVSLTAVLVLLLNPSMLCAPKFLQAHLISMASDTIGMGLENMKPDVRLMDCYLSAFERSVILYLKHMSTLQMNDCPSGDEDSVLKFSTYGGNSQPSFESYVKTDTRKKINDLISKLDHSWQSRLHNMLLRKKSDLATSSIAYIKESKHIVDASFRDEILSNLSCIILKAFSDEVDSTALYASGDTSPQDIYLLASILKLMSCSLLQAICCLMHNGNLGCLKTLKDFSSCKEYDSIVRIISCFQQFNICLPIQKPLYGLMETHPTQHKESKLMLLHFLGLLSLSFCTGLDFLVKGCISTIVTLMNLFVFEGGNLDALRFVDRLEPISSGSPHDNVQEVDQSSSLVVASKFQKIQTLYLSENGQAETSTNSSGKDNMQCVVSIEEEKEETCNGEIYLKCILKTGEKQSEFDDLVDFVECKRGKDYSDWLKDRQRYRKWKCEKMAVLRWKKKKKTWKYMKERVVCSLND
ncbi:hypothetical protein ACSBR1_001670 [Camellia fascicularis]